MMDFHFNVAEEQYKGHYELIYSDIDSFVYRFKCYDVYDDIVVPIIAGLIYHPCNENIYKIILI